MSPVLEAIQAQRLIAVVRLDHYDQALSLMRALQAGGISLVEFTLTGAGAYTAISTARQEFASSMYVGVGTTLQAHEAEEAIRAGAQFVVTPVVQPEVIAVCRSRGVPVICGAFTPTEAWNAHSAGADLIKIFPASVGGPSYLRNLLGVFPQLRIIPTGGIDVDNVRAYLEAGAVAVGAGSNLVSPQAVARGEWDQITARARAYVTAASL